MAEPLPPFVIVDLPELDDSEGVAFYAAAKSDPGRLVVTRATAPDGSKVLILAETDLPRIAAEYVAAVEAEIEASVPPELVPAPYVEPPTFALPGRSAAASDLLRRIRDMHADCIEPDAIGDLLTRGVVDPSQRDQILAAIEGEFTWAIDGELA